MAPPDDTARLDALLAFAIQQGRCRELWIKFPNDRGDIRDQLDEIIAQKKKMPKHDYRNRRIPV